MNSVLRAAIEYLRNGWHSVPVPPGGKKPVLLGWQDLRLGESDLPERFDHPTGIGLLTGQASNGLIDVDLDCDEAVQLADAFLPVTGMQSGRPSRPKSHRWYRVGGQVPSLVFKDVHADKTTLLEIRSDGHQTLVPPSVHPEGEAYIWHGELNPAEIDSAELNLRVHRLAAATLLSRHWPRESGSRHAISNATAGMLLRGGWDEEDVAHFVGVVARSVGDEEAAKRAKDAVATARTLAAGRKATGAPSLVQLLGDEVVRSLREWLALDRVAQVRPWDRPVPFRSFDLPEFPSAALPHWLRVYVEALSEATQTPLALAGGVALGACSVAVAGRVRVLIRAGWEEPTNLFVVVVLPPAERKTAVVAHATAAILDHEHEQARRLEPEIRAAETRHHILEQRLRETAKKAAKAKPAERDGLEREVLRVREELDGVFVPVRPRLFADDVTPERLQGLLYEHGGRFAVISAEGGIFETLAGRYTSTGAPNLDVFLKGHAGEALRVDRVGRTSELVNQPALTVVLAIQNDVLRTLSTKPGFRGRGLLARFLYAIPSGRLGKRKIGPPPVPPDVQSTFRRNLTSLLDLPQPVEAQGGPSAWTVPLSPEAERRFRDYEESIEPQLDRLASLGNINDWAGKLAGATARIAGILHMAIHIDQHNALVVPISSDTVSAAIAIGRFYIDHAKAAFSEMGADPEVDAADHVLAWIRRSGAATFSERDAYQGTKGRFKKVADLRPALQVLIDHEYIRERPREVRPGPGRPSSPIYDVNPQIVDSEDTGNTEQGDQKTIETDSPSVPTSNSEPPPHRHNPHNPQNERAGDDEVVL